MKEWVEQEIGQILTLNYGWSLPEKKRTFGDFPVYGSNGIVGSHSMPLVKTKGLIVGRKGSAGNVHYSRKPFCPIDTTFFITQDDTSLNIEFLFFLLIHANLKRLLGDVGVPGLNRDVAYKEKIKYPIDFSEQQRIAYVLSVVQTAIEQQERLIKLTRELKSALMHKLFTEGLHGEKQKMTEIGLVPESWEVLPLDMCATIQTGTAKGREIADDESLELPYLRVANVQDGYLDLAEIKTIKIRANEKERYLLKKGDVVLTEGGDFDKLGRGFIWQGQIENCIHQNHIFAVRVNLDKLLPAFFAYQSQSPYGKKYFLSVAHKTSNLACINTAKLKRFPVLVPKLKEQEQITDILQTIEIKLRIHARRRNLLEELFRTLLHQLMTGQTRVNDIDLPGFVSGNEG